MPMDKENRIDVFPKKHLQKVTYFIAHFAKNYILLPPIQLRCPISFYGQVTLIVPFLFLVCIFDYYALSSLSYFQLYPPLPILIFPPF